jgi:beta-galactosidase
VGAFKANARGPRRPGAQRRAAHALDPSRPVTAGMDSGYTGGRGTTRSLDVQGFNYQREDLDAFHRAFPALPLMGTETASAFATRDVYATDRERGYVSAYDVNKPDYGATAEEWWSFYAAREWLAGGFVWTGFDYRGEPSPYEWPCISSHFGILDTCGFPKDTFYYYQAWWSGRPVLHLFPHWTWPGREGQPVEVWCHANTARVELRLDGTSLGTKEVPRNGHVAWQVPYAPGRLEAVGLDGGREILRDVRETAGPARAVILTADRPRLRADAEDVACITARVVDAQGRTVPAAADGIRFAVSGPGNLIGVGNGDPSSHEADRATERRAFNGRCLALVQATGTAGLVEVEGSAAGLVPGLVQLISDAASLRPAVA